MKTKLILFVTVLAVAPIIGSAAPAGKLTLTSSRNVLVNVGGGNEIFVNLRLASNLALIENATPGSGHEKMVGKLVPFHPRSGTRTQALSAPGWHTTWTFKPDGTANVYETGGEIGTAVQVQGKTLEWPKNLVDTKTGRKEPGPQTRNLLVNARGHGFVDGKYLLNIRIDGNKAVIAATGGYLGKGKNGNISKINNGGRYYIYFDGWGTDCTFSPDGTVTLYERPRQDGVGFGIPVAGDTLKWPK